MPPTSIVAAVCAFVLGFLAILHVCWAAGSRWGNSVVIPQVEGKPVFQPSAAASLLVALALLAASILALSRGQILWPTPPGSWAHWATVGAGAVLILRAIGEFRLVGFFKRVRGTAFARWDDRLFSPLSLGLGAGLVWVAIG